MPLAGDILTFPQYRVLLRQAWGDAWQASAAVIGGDYLEVQRAQEVAAPEVGRCDLLYRFGQIKREDTTTTQLYAPLDLVDWFCCIQTLGPLGVWNTLWTGTIAVDEREIYGGAVGTFGASGDQSLFAYALEHLLDRQAIASAWMTNNGSSELEIDVCPVFNDDFVWGFREVGNRSQNQIVRGAAAGGDSHVFADDGSVWTNKDIAEYLLAHWQPGGVTFTLAGQTADLDNIVLPRLDLRGMTLRQALNTLIDRRRGLGWCVRYAAPDELPEAYGTEDNPVQVWVFSTVEDNVVLDGQNPEVLLRANTEPATFDVDRIDLEPCLTVTESLSAYGTIRVLGRPVVSMFTLKVSDSTLKIGWTSAEATAYAGVSGADNAAKDAERSTEKYRHVYQSFLVNYTGDAPELYRNPTVNDDGSIDPSTAAPIRQWGHARALLPALPLAKPWALSDSRPEYREPLAIVQYASGSNNLYGLLDRMRGADLPAGHFHALDNQFGFSVQTNPNHVMAKSHFTGAATNTTDVQPAYNYTTLVATVAAENDERLKVITTIAGNDPTRELLIEVEDAELWWIARDTVTDVTDGALVTFSPSGDETLDYPQGCVLRNDVGRLKRIACLAKAWYGRTRAAVRLGVRGLLTTLPVGTFLASIEDPEQTREVGAVVTVREWDFAAGRSQVSTGFGEMDFASFR